MGYTSRITGELEISIVSPTLVEAASTYPEELVKLAKEHNISLPEPENNEREGFSDEAWKKLQEHPDFDFWFYSEDSALLPNDESGKAYDFGLLLDHILKVAKEDGCVLNGTLIKEGQAQGDIERFLFKNDHYITEKVIITWPDGTKYE
jgi:hypothetical protein